MGEGDSLVGAPVGLRMPFPTHSGLQFGDNCSREVLWERKVTEEFTHKPVDISLLNILINKNIIFRSFLKIKIADCFQIMLDAGRILDT